MAYVDEVLADTPIAYWRVEEASGNFADSSGNGWTATQTGTPTYRQPPAGSTGTYSVLLNGTSQYAQASSAIEFSSPDSLSLEAWFKTTISANTGGIIECGGGGPELLIIGSTGLLRFDSRDAGAVCSSTIAANDGVWHHVVVTKNGATTVMYIDGVDRTGSITDRTMVNNANSIGFGARWTISTPTANTYFPGNMDEIAIYNGALSAARVSAHYEAGTAPTFNPAILTRSPSRR